MKPKNTDQNSKDSHWKIPVDLPNVNPTDYKKALRCGPPNYTIPGHPTSDETAPKK